MRRKTVGNKVVSVLLAGALAASLAACGGNTANTGADAGNNAADAGTKEDTKSAETETAADTEESSDAAVADSGYEAKDLGGRTIKIGLWWDEYWDSNYQSLDDIEAAGGSWTNLFDHTMKRLFYIRHIFTWNDNMIHIYSFTISSDYEIVQVCTEK